MTNVTISISTSQIFRSWVAIFQPRPPMASLFRSLYGMPGLAPRIHGCFILRATRLSSKLLEQGYVKERLKSSLRKFYGRYGDLFKQYEVCLSQMLNDILWPDHIQWQPPTDQTLYRTRPLTEIWVVSIEHLRRVWHADRGRLLLRTPGPVPLGLAYVLRVETNPFPNLSLFYWTMLFEYPSVLSRFCFDFASQTVDIADNSKLWLVCFYCCFTSQVTTFQSETAHRLDEGLTYNRQTGTCSLQKKKKTRSHILRSFLSRAVGFELSTHDVVKTLESGWFLVATNPTL